MAKKLFVRGIDWNATQEEFHDLFAPYGELKETIIITEASGRSKGFGFVTFVNAEDADRAMAELEGQKFLSRPINVTEARPSEGRPAGGNFRPRPANDNYRSEDRYAA